MTIALAVLTFAPAAFAQTMGGYGGTTAGVGTTGGVGMSSGPSDAAAQTPLEMRPGFGPQEDSGGDDSGSTHTETIRTDDSRPDQRANDKNDSGDHSRDDWEQVR
ncbi:MAG TPA: hypothetical protein VIX59_18675 [Candidatus Binataceae bacterium]